MSAYTAFCHCIPRFNAVACTTHSLVGWLTTERPKGQSRVMPLEHLVFHWLVLPTGYLEQCRQLSIALDKSGVPWSHLQHQEQARDNRHKRLLTWWT